MKKPKPDTGHNTKREIKQSGWADQGGKENGGTETNCVKAKRGVVRSRKKAKGAQIG